MKIILIIAGIFLALGLIAISMAVMSQTTPKDLGILNGKLRPCPDSPNCVCSESTPVDDQQHFIDPLPASEESWQKLKFNIIHHGGTIQTDTGEYVHATFTTTIFRYVDDVELRWDKAKQQIHLRSASRMGHSDFGMNRARIEKLTHTINRTTH